MMGTDKSSRNSLDRLGTLATLLRDFAVWRVERGITAHQAEVLVHVLDAGAPSAADLSRRVGISTASMSRLLEQVEAAGWIVRVPDPRDARRVLVQPSKRLASETVALTIIGTDGAPSVVARSVG
ncbi:MAG: MarR family transcriptional regulator [Thermoleophilia bacterium]|nr:MarR family transcriptional regulator [Thermoleophilia bacterium]